MFRKTSLLIGQTRRPVRKLLDLPFVSSPLVQLSSLAYLVPPYIPRQCHYSHSPTPVREGIIFIIPLGLANEAFHLNCAISAAGRFSSAYSPQPLRLLALAQSATRSHGLSPIFHIIARTSCCCSPRTNRLRQSTSSFVSLATSQVRNTEYHAG